jgi:histidinol phosphatase-like PHP family hydrolase/predicted phosphodiesterase/sugar phosphate isomerase/epimerase
MCDLHLPFDKNALQYQILEWAIADVKKKQPDCIAFCGDATCDGNEAVYDYFVKTVGETGIPFLYIPGNSDLRSLESEKTIRTKASPCKNTMNGISIYALNDCDERISDEQLQALAHSGDNDIVFMHHPMKNHNAETADKLLKWRELHKRTVVFYGHMHRSVVNENSVSLQAMDPDKSIGESPCITYYETDTKEIHKAHYFSPVPTDLYQYFGVSCYNPFEQIRFAIRNNLKYLELRPNCVGRDINELKSLIHIWRRNGGEGLSLHLPDIVWKDGAVLADKTYDRLIELVSILKVDRVTQHVPKVSVKEIEGDSKILEKICAYIADRLNGISHDIVVGVENMHMTENESADANRRFGYIPEECIAYMETLARLCKHKVGVNFDIGHARNNAPYSQKYQISTWFSMLGKYIVGYHMHQVKYENGTFENHMPIEDIYGNLISYASFFKCWLTGRINKAPVIFEMRPENAYEITINTFEHYKRKKVSDIHSHTVYSHCGRDDPHEIIMTAIENGLSLFGISDHNYGIGYRKKAYVAEMRELALQYRDKINLLCGIEIATLPELYDIKCPDEIKDFDYCLIEHITYENSIVKDKLFEFCDNVGILCGIAHTDLFAYCDMYGFDYAEFFNKMGKNKIFWEMNVSYDSIHKYKEHQYVIDFMNDAEKQKIIKDAGVYISVGFDSHRYEDYDGFRVHEMYDFLQKNQIKTIDELFAQSYLSEF